VKGLSKPKQKELTRKIQSEAKKLSSTGNVMMCELVQIAEDFLLENNKDPKLEKMSAWERMKMREAEEAKGAEMEIKERERKLHMTLEEEDDDSKAHLNGLILEDSLKVGKIEKEIVRQMEAIDAAAADRKRIRSGSLFEMIQDGSSEKEEKIENIFDDFDDDDEYEEDPTGAVSAGSSRYKTDFIELGLLGKGGGGEVQKVRNRLDRRLYAIKKIFLLSEKGRFAKQGSIQNQKLRREVTTISRMTHKNIVRYYQAWVEGIMVPEPSNNNNVETMTESSKDVNTKETEHSNDELTDGIESSNGQNNWWQSTPVDKDFDSDWSEDDDVFDETPKKSSNTLKNECENDFKVSK